MDKDEELVDHEDGAGGGNKFHLSEAMLNKKHLNKTREDVKKMKTVMNELQQYVQQHQITINRDLVNDEKLKITVELLEDQIKERMTRDLGILEDRVKQKVKKRLKKDEIVAFIRQKVDRAEYKKNTDRIEGVVQVLNDRVDNELPAFKIDILNALKAKADRDEVKQQMEVKADKEMVDSLVERLNHMQESLMEAIKTAQAAAKAAEGSGDDEDEVSGEE